MEIIAAQISQHKVTEVSENSYFDEAENSISDGENNYSDEGENICFDQTTIRKVPNSLESHLHSESVLDKFETFFNNFSNDNDEKQINDMTDSKKEDLINADINEEGEYFASKTDEHYETKNVYKSLASESNSIEQERSLKWSIKSCKVSLKKIKSDNKSSDFDFSASGYEVSAKSEHDKYLLDINQNESFTSLWKMHLGKFSGGFSCYSCIDIFSRKNDLRNHQKKYHPNKATKNVSDLRENISDNPDQVLDYIIRNQYEKETNDILEETNLIKDKVPNDKIERPYEMETNEIEAETNPIQLSLENTNTVDNSMDKANDKAAKCDFCEKEYRRHPGNFRKHLPLQKCQLCNINIGDETSKEANTTVEEDSIEEPTTIDESMNPFYSWDHGLTSTLESLWNRHKRFTPVEKSKEGGWCESPINVKSTVIGKKIAFNDFVQHKKRKISEIPKAVSDKKHKITSEEKNKETKPSKPMNQCGQCSYKTKDRSNLKKHVKSVHEGVKEKCNKCTYSASSKGNLKKHMFSKHHSKTN